MSGKDNGPTNVPKIVGARRIAGIVYRQPDKTRRPNRMSPCERCGKLTKGAICGGCQKLLGEAIELVAIVEPKGQLP